jgi:SAM-dependent methyltransferase
MGAPSLEETRRFWEEHPVGDSLVGSRATLYDYFRGYDDAREAPDVEPYAFANAVHGFESSGGKRVLDYGCGNGYVLAHYARNGADVYGVDITDRAVDLSRARFDLLGLAGTFVRNDGSTVPFESEFFDVVCAMGVLHHIPDPAPVIAELHRVLKPGGTLIVMLYHRASFRYRVVFPVRRVLGPAKFRGRTQQEMVNLNDGAGNPWGTVYSREEARALLAAFEDHRFRVSKLGAEELALWWSPAARVLTRVLPRGGVGPLTRRWGWNLYCAARKPA